MLCVICMCLLFSVAFPLISFQHNQNPTVSHLSALKFHDSLLDTLRLLVDIGFVTVRVNPRSKS
jgi:hypothetical protein